MTHRFSRRRALAGFGSVSLGALIAACGDSGGDSGDASTKGRTTTAERRGGSRSALAERFDEESSCTLTLEQTEGPYYFDADAVRSDIREDREGVRLRLGVRVREADSCKPLRNAVVDVWHCDGLGVYSGFDSAEGERFLRGTQVTDSEGIVEFVTVYPGWYQGRTTHIHAKVHVDNQTALTTQFFFDDDVTERVYSRRPYSEMTGRNVFNDDDGIFDESLLLALSREGDGYLGLISLDVRAA
jgi:protocatechuate 3,4-dioxygenase beta subunit